ncbi:TetR/AcrR family transcriptional regulator [Pseudonocardia alni]|jgi:AcrR family transcriptional regulator|uniref:Helix-turn-helix domain-containing protein n=1 Tax=Pseudonocardia alni subsp. carboxydivorans TaxID=415010 RepID=A0ABU9AL99_PSEA5|nr:MULTISPECIES: TetR/AcrR family transcriptional regulator [Pseudonocardia]MCF7547179.1 TetR/AcrR family transcriptional regulator [Pseudonocardia sp. WMMC193]MYW73591.1 TetR family transcriptional regulator [Pseudonocardia sp. SID8383]WFG47522.1 TetR/AcrR family transcriptional regulator [Pseudonocardia alni]
MSERSRPRRTEDLTARARIRHAALELFAERGVAGTPMRAVAARVGVTVGLIVHHFGTKEALREAVELDIVDRFADAILSAPADGSGADVAAARDRAVAAMLAESPAVVDYLRRAVLDPHGERGDLVSKLSALAADQVGELRRRGLASQRSTIGEQVLTIMIRQLGQVFLQPLADRIIDEFGESSDDAPSPLIVVRLEHRIDTFPGQ